MCPRRQAGSDCKYKEINSLFNTFWAILRWHIPLKKALAINATPVSLFEEAPPLTCCTPGVGCLITNVFIQEAPGQFSLRPLRNSKSWIPRAFWGSKEVCWNVVLLNLKRWSLMFLPQPSSDPPHPRLF